MFEKYYKKILLACVSSLALVTAVYAQAPKTLVYCSEGSPEGFDPALYTTGTTFDASGRTVYNRLVEFRPGTIEVIPALAEKWTVSEDGKTYTFNLRKNVKFHTTSFFRPKRDFNADDVIFSFERQGDPEHPWQKATPGSSVYEYYSAMGMGDLIDSIEKIDDYTVRFHLIKPESPFLANIAMDFASIVSEEYATYLLKTGKARNMNQQPIGTGPWIFHSYVKDSTIRFIANKQYWDGRPALERLVFSITPDSSIRWAKLQKGECHHMPFPNPADVESMQNHSDTTVLSQEGLNVGYLAFNTQKKPFDDLRVRKALYMAINKPAIIDAIFQNTGTVAKNPIPPTLWAYNDDIQDWPYDPQAAKELLEEAGYPEGFETDLWAMPVQRPYNPNARRMAELIQANWSDVGVKAKIVSYEWGEYIKRSKDGEHTTLLLGWTGDNGDPDNFLGVLLSCQAIGASNRSAWCNEEFDALLDQARQISDIQKRKELYLKAQEIFHQEVPWVPIAHSIVYEPMRRNLENYKISPLGLHTFGPTVKLK